MSYIGNNGPQSPDSHHRALSDISYGINGGGAFHPMRTSGSGDSVDENIQVIKVQPKEIVVVDERSEYTLHRALSANQVCITA